jgi:ppGpp synthetase/RelA/SpoT-type nucleotidyltranferase
MSMPAADLPEVFDPVAHGERAAAAYREKRGLYLEFAQCIKTLLDEALRGSVVKTQSVEARAKTIHSFTRKAGLPHPLDPTRPKYEDPITEITDMAGVRVVTFLPTAVDQVGEAVHAQFEVIEQEDKFDRLSLEQRFGYASVHYLVRLKDNRTGLLEYRRFLDLVGEIQVRTILQHAWAEIEHDIEYKGADSVAASVRRRFMAVAGMLEIADREFQAIQEEVHRRRRVATEAVVSGLLDRAELTSGALRSYLDSRLGADRRVGESNYEVWVGVLRELGFNSLQQVDDCIDDLDDAAVSRAIWGPKKRGQLWRFEGLLLAGMGDYYIEHHPSRGLDHFVELRRRWLERVKEHSGSVRSYRPR